MVRRYGLSKISVAILVLIILVVLAAAYFLMAPPKPTETAKKVKVAILF
ncbi:MAG: hypothetical protein QW092_06030 [Candidatus Korarchaeum sp.]